MASSQGPDTPGALSRYAESAADIVTSMTEAPYYVAGSWSITTPLMTAGGGGLLAKEGAEGFYAMAFSPATAATLTGRLKVTDDCAIGVALKINDGSMGRGRNPVIMKLLEILGADAVNSPELQQFREWPIRNVAGVLVGDVRAEFELEVL
jgi:L-asparaginase II